jgi:hypothetical protein
LIIVDGLGLILRRALLMYEVYISPVTPCLNLKSINYMLEL